MPALKGGASIAPGTFLGRYRIERLLGAGGMAEVYAARDERLGRGVALKVLPDGDTARVERFIREAQLASSLSHPAVVAVHDSGEARLDDDRVVHYLAMELIDGEDLARWARGRDLRKVIAAIADVADGLSRAHASGIIHRDLKPRNIMVANGGHAKVLDFGVAKLTERAEGLPSQADTAPTAAVGTAAYMSPEQIEGRDLDPRTDIFSLGCVLFEIVTGRPPFQRATPVETMHATLHDPTPSIRGVRSDVPPGLERVVRKCLVKDREERYQSMKDVALDLRELLREDATAPATPSRRRSLLAIGLALAAVVILLAIWNAVRIDREVRAPLQAPPQPTMIRMTNSGNIMAGAISPDGNYIAYVTHEGEMQTLWVKQIATATAVRVIPPATVDYTELRISPDGNYIYYGVATRAEPNVYNLMQIPLLGGTPRRIAPDFDGWMTVSPDGKQVAFRRFSAIERVYRMTIADIESGAERVVLSRRYPDMIGNLAWSPNGRVISFTGARMNAKTGPVLFNLDLPTGRITTIESPQWRSFGSMAWMPDGSGLVVTAADQLQQPLQVWLLPADGPARKITSDVSQYELATVTANARNVAVGRSELSANIWLVPLDNPRDARALTSGLGNRTGMGGVRFLPDGSILYIAPDNGKPSLHVVSRAGGDGRPVVRAMTAWDPAVSPDGRRIAFLSDRSGALEIWTCNRDGSDLQQLTKDGRPIQSRARAGESALGASASPTWFPDSRSLAFASMGTVQAAWKMTIGTPNLQRLTNAPVSVPRVSPDGSRLLCRLRSTEPGVPLWRTALVPIGTNEPTRYFDVPRHGGPPNAQWLADGSRFAFVDNAGGVANIWIQDLRGGEPRQVTQFDSGEICAYDVSSDARYIAVSRCERVNDLVMIRDFR